ncbi:hypothetical protein KIW84_013413, partial [Lathyrus oleraceus]
MKIIEGKPRLHLLLLCYLPPSLFLLLLLLLLTIATSVTKFPSADAIVIKLKMLLNLMRKVIFSNLQVVAEEGLKVFTFKQLHFATGGFSKSNVVGHGGFGLVYHGLLNDGRKVGIKLMDQAGKQGEEEFKVEVELLS